MLGLIVGSVAIALLADAALDPDNRRVVRARLRGRRLARVREQQAEHVAGVNREQQRARKMRTIAEAQLPHLRAVLAQAQKEHRYCVTHCLTSIARDHADTIDKTLAEITRLEPWLDR